MKQNNLNNSWLYYKLFCNINVTNDVILDINNLLLENNIENWFYIRYSAPYNHIRLRLNFKEKFIEKIIYNYQRSNIKTVYKIEKTKYNRELKRYSIFPYELTETLFINDSKNTLRFLEGKSINEQIYYMVFSMYNFFRTFKYTDTQIIELANGAISYFYEEFNDIKDLKKNISKQYREESENLKLIALINNQHIKNNDNFFFLRKELIDQHLKKQRNNDLDDFVTSHVHMNCNRLFQNNQRLFELISYEFMVRTLKSINYIEKVS